jgi:hypothetical protein
MERRLQLVESGPFAPHRWPSIALASAELRRPRHLHAVRSDASAPSPARSAVREGGVPPPSRRR